MTQRLGRAWIITSALGMLETMPGAKLDIGGVTRSTVTGNNAVLGFAEAPREATIECEISLARGTSLKEIEALRSVTVHFQCDTGQTYVLANAWVADTLTLTDGDGGKVPVKFAARSCEEMGASA